MEENSNRGLNKKREVNWQERLSLQVVRNCGGVVYRDPVMMRRMTDEMAGSGLVIGRHILFTGNGSKDSAT